MFGVSDHTAGIDVLDVLGGNPRGSGDGTEGFDLGIFFPKASEFLDETFRFLCIHARDRNGLGDVPVLLAPDLEKSEIVEGEPLENELIHSSRIAVFVKLERNNGFTSANRDVAGFVIDSRFEILTQNGRDAPAPRRLLSG